MTQEYAPLTQLTVSKAAIEHCQYPFWHSLFKKHTPVSRIIGPLPAPFIQYLKQDGIKLPADPTTSSFYTNDIERNDDNDYSDWEDDSEEVIPNDDKKDTIDPVKDFPEFHSKIKDVISELGPVTPKLNWSAPRDATWILPNNNMKCSEINEIYLLLNASNYIMYDLEHAFDDCSDASETSPQYYLILRQWFNINPALEFRVFVKDQKIIGVSQRDLNYYDYLEALSDTFKDTIDEFIEEEIIQKFPEKDFVIDLYIPRPFNRVFIIDINPFGRSTDPLMYSWNELVNIKLEEDDYELRLVKENNVARFATKEHSENHVPRDVLEASMDPNAIKELTKKWQELLKKQEEESDSDDEN